MSRWAHAHPEGEPMGQTFGSRLDAADDARKEAKEADPPDVLMGECPSCGRLSRMLAVFGGCPYEDCRYGSGS